LQGRLCKAVSAEVLGQHTLFGRQVPSDRMLACAVLACLLAGPAVAADDPDKPPMVCPSFWKTSQFYELCTIQHQMDCVHCEGFITGVASALQKEQIRCARVCIPKGALYRIRKTHCAGETGKKPSLVPRTGVEPVRSLWGRRRILSPLCLPISPSRPSVNCRRWSPSPPCKRQGTPDSNETTPATNGFVAITMES